MPIAPFEREVMHLLAKNRNPDSYIGGATVLHQSPDSPRSSADIDLFHDTAEAVQQAAERDMQILQTTGYNVELVNRQPSFYRGIVTKENQSTKLEWVQDSAFRFFPVEPDSEMGWRLNFWDAATNKVLAFGGRDEIRDWLDVIYLHEKHLSFGALVWAAAAKDPGLTPEFLLDSARRFGRFPAHPQKLDKLRLSSPVDMDSLQRQFTQALGEAEALVAKLPPAEIGCLYLNAVGTPICPVPDSLQFPELVRHFGSVKGAWPRLANEQHS